MPILRMREIMDLTEEERVRRVSDLRAELLRLRAMVKAGGGVEDSGRIKEIRKTIARIKTVQAAERATRQGHG
ncbi:MAG: 50S ribosomal protein L29 [Candidatus Bathyarchaeia archaeon]